MFDFVSRSVRDPLLTAARFCVFLLCGLAIFALVMVGIGLGAVLTIERADTFAKLAQAGAGTGAYWTLNAVLVAIMVVLFIGYRFFAELWEVIASVDHGDPFQSGNAERLARMGWLSLIAQLILLAIAIPAKHLVTLSERVGENASFDPGLGIGSVLLTLVLFVLARVFHVGAAMRDDLEGTV